MTIRSVRCCFNEAAGIPRGRPVRSTPCCTVSNWASMRPRVFPAEDSPVSGLRHSASWCFNEAAGIPRGRHPEAPRRRPPGRRASMRPRVFPAEDGEGIDEGVGGLVASMRPRVFPAEDCSRSPIRRRGRGRFNEAAGIPRGRPWRGARPPCRSWRFNEAAGIPRGRLRPPPR